VHRHHAVSSSNFRSSLTDATRLGDFTLPCAGRQAARRHIEGTTPHSCDHMAHDLLQLGRRLERALALQNERLNHASGGSSMPLGGGFVHFRGDGHPLNQALGLIDPITESELRAAEDMLAGTSASPVVLEVSPAADAALWPLLASRGYRVQQFQQLWSRELAEPSSAAAAVTIRMAEPDEEYLFSQLVGAAFMEAPDWRTFEPPFVSSLRVSGIVGCIASVDGEPAGGAVLGIVDGVALLAGDGVLHIPGAHITAPSAP